MGDIVDYQDSEPYLEAKQYMERMELETRRSESLSSLSEVLDSGPCVSVPCAPLTYATVQWDTQQTPAEPPTPAHERDSTDGQRLDWTLNLLDHVPDQDGAVDFEPEEESEPDDSQTCDSQRSDAQALRRSPDQTSTTSADLSDSRADATEEHFELSDDPQIFTDSTHFQPLQESSQSQEEEELQVLVFSNITSSHEEIGDPSSEEQAQAWTDTEANGDPSDIQDENQGADRPLEEEESDRSLLGINSSRADVLLSDHTDGAVELQEEVLMQEPDKMSTSVKVTEMDQDKDGHSFEFLEQFNKQDQYVEQPVRPEEKAEAEKDLLQQASESEQRELFVHPDESDPSEQNQCSDEETPECSDGNPNPSSVLNHVEKPTPDVAAVPCVTEEMPVPDISPAGPSVRDVVVVDRAEAQRLAEKLYRLDGFQRTDVVRHLDKNNEFSHAVGEEFLKFFDFTNQSLEEALRSFLKEVVLIGETQERERVLQCFSARFQQCNPDMFSSAESVLTLTCAVMLLNTDLHGQNVGKPMTSAEFVSNLDGMNGGKDFNKYSLKRLYNSIKTEPFQWAVEEQVLAKSMMFEQDLDGDKHLRSKSNPFQDLPHDAKATVFQKALLKRKSHADVDGKRTPWGKRRWKAFYAELKGMVLYLREDDYGKDWLGSEEAISIHHALAERALDYTKRPHVFRLQTADWRVFLFEAGSTEKMNSWIGRINLVSALYSSPPFPAAVGSQKRFCRPILPATRSNLLLDKQLQSHAAMLQSFQQDLTSLQQEAPESRKTKARELEELRQREEFLQYEKSRYEVYLRVLEAWQTLEKCDVCVRDRLTLFDEALWREEEDEGDAVMKRSHSSPSLELETPPQPVAKVRRNVSERRTYRKIIIPRRNKEL